VHAAWVNSSCVVQSSYIEYRGNGFSRAIFEVTSEQNRIYRQAAAVSFSDSQYWNKNTPEELALQQNTYEAFNSASNNISCFIPPISIKYTASSQVRGKQHSFCLVFV
jgi:hypothetical protein